MLNKNSIIPIMIVIGLTFLNIIAVAEDLNATYIKQLEEQLFSTSYENEQVTDRLARLEETIFGMTSASDSEYVRVERLKALLNPDSAKEDKQTVSDETSSNNDITYQNDNNNSYSNVNPQNQSINNYADQVKHENEYTYAPIHPDDEEIEDYPAVSYLENQVFNQTYKGEDITKRLERLEQNIFNETKSNLSLSERLDELKVAVLGTSNLQLAPRMPSNQHTYPDNFGNNQVASGQTYQANQPLNPQQYYQSPEMNTFQNNNQYPSVDNLEYTPLEPGYDPGNISQESLQEITSRLEEQLMGQVFPGEPLNQRLDRLEMQVFNRTAAGYTPESRIERLVAVTAADATTDPNDLKKIKRLRKIQTGLTVGGILFSLLRGFLF